MSENSDPCGCNAILIQNIDTFASTTATQLAILRTTTKESFEEIKKGIKTGGSIIYAGIPISGNGSWDDFRQQRQTRFDNFQYDSSLDQAVGELHQYLSKEVVTAWAMCKENCAKKNSGFASWVERFDAETVTVRFYLNSAPGVPTPARIQMSQIVGGRAYEKNVDEGAAFPVDFEFQDEVPVRRTFFRQPGAAFSVTVDVDFDGTAVYLPAYDAEGSIGGVPIGSVSAYAGRHDRIPKGWMLCDGTPLLVSEAQELYNVIGTSHGAGIDPRNGEKTKDFNLPDYRGLFLRGTDLGTGRDPDAKDRIRAYGGGNSGDQVGSVQADQFGRHHHHLDIRSSLVPFGAGPYHNPVEPQAPSAEKPHVPMLDAGGNETRPKNAYVNYIIRVR